MMFVPGLRQVERPSIWFRTKKFIKRFAILIKAGLFVYLTSPLSIQLYQAGKSYWRERLSTVDLPAPTSLDQLLFYIENIIYLFYKNKLP
jgi:hypothetical protein